MVPARKERSERPRAGRDGRRLAAIAFTDIVGYSILMASDERRTHARWMSILEEIIRPLAAKHHGVIVKSTGDGVLAEFPSALDAVEWAQAVQAAVAEQRGTEGTEDLIALRIAIHIGEVVSGRSDIYGDGVNLTARLQEHAPPGGIILSETARELLRGTVGAAARDLGLLRLKNFEGPVRAYALDPPTPALAGQVADEAPSRRRQRHVEARAGERPEAGLGELLLEEGDDRLQLAPPVELEQLALRGEQRVVAPRRLLRA